MSNATTNTNPSNQNFETVRLNGDAAFFVNAATGHNNWRQINTTSESVLNWDGVNSGDSMFAIESNVYEGIMAYVSFESVTGRMATRIPNEDGAYGFRVKLAIEVDNKRLSLFGWIAVAGGPAITRAEVDAIVAAATIK